MIYTQAQIFQKKWEKKNFKRAKQEKKKHKLTDKTHKVKKDSSSYNDTGLPLNYKNELHEFEFQWEQAAILEIECDVNRRRLLEAIHTYKTKILQ